MTASVLGLIGALLGTLLGSGITFWLQRTAYQREKSERHEAFKRESSAIFLGAAHEVFDAISAAYRNETDIAQRRVVLSNVPTVRAQSAFDTLRLAATAATIEDAGRLWRHLRDRGIPTGASKPNFTIGAWKNEYRNLRHRFLDAARAELHLPSTRPATADTDAALS